MAVDATVLFELPVCACTIVAAALLSKGCGTDGYAGNVCLCVCK